MKKENKMTKGISRLLSIVLAVAMLISGAPESFLQYTPFEAVKIFAATYAKYDIADYTKRDPETNSIRISTWMELCEYSQAYYEATYGTYGEGVTHQNDTILLAIADASSINLYEAGYEPIGNEVQPFQGKILFETGSFDTFDLNTPLFGTVKDCVPIAENTDEGTPHELKIRRVGDASGEPLLAYRVLSDGDPATSADWSFIFQTYESGSDIKYAGAIGEIEAEAGVVLTMVNDAEQGRSPVETNSTGTVLTGDEPQTDPRPVDVGAVCGKIGSNASLSVKYTGTNTDFTIESVNGNAGGLVGSMETGSTLTVLAGSVNLQGTDVMVKAGNGYAGGIVGRNNGGTVNIQTEEPYMIRQQLVGQYGAGSVFGYYATTGESEFDVGKYDIDCKVSAVTAGSGSCGGLFGVLEFTATENAEIANFFTVKGAEGTGTTLTSAHAATANGGEKAGMYGGIIGSFKAASMTDTLEIRDLGVNSSNALEAALFGGGIASVTDASYVRFSGFDLLGADNSNKAQLFGGLVASTDYGYIYASDVTLGAADHKITNFTGGGIVGDLGDGVLGLTGNLDLSNIAPAQENMNGQIVSLRDNALIYAESGFSLIANGITLDNVGAWGDVLTFGDNLDKDSVFTESDHLITLGEATPSDIKSAQDYANVSILFQIDPSRNKFLADTQAMLAQDTDLHFTGDVDLSGTGLRGITRDNGTSHIVYSGTITGTEGKSLTLDVQNVGGTGRPVYTHKYNGLIAEAENAVFQDLSVGGKIWLKNVRNGENDTEKSMYSGAFMATAKGDVTVTDCNTLTGLDMVEEGKLHFSGRVLGDALTGTKNITISGGVYDGNLSGGSDESCAGGVIGYINNPGSAVDWVFSDLTLRGTVSGSKRVGGLVAEAHGNSKAVLKLTSSEGGDGIVADGIVITGDHKDAMGGLMGFAWYLTDVEVTKVSVSGTPVVKQKGAGGAAGLVYLATGHWTVADLKLGYTDQNSTTNAIRMEMASKGSVGMIVNKGIDNSNGIYLEVPEGSYALLLDAGSVIAGDAVFDEICAYSAANASSIMKNGQGIISIGGASYANQTEQGERPNPNTRYYYNLRNDYATLDNSASDQDKLMSWGLRQYAASNIKKYFKDLFANTIPAGDYDMNGYSWYPITLDQKMKVNGTFTFYNQEFKEAEDGKSSDNKWSPNAKTQHYMMQNGLFYDVNKDLTIGDIRLKGTVGAVDGTSGTGALIYATVSGKSSGEKTVVDGSNGSIVLDGIRIWNLSDAASYAPLLINKASDYVTMYVNEVSTTNAYVQEGTTISAATSLVGRAGTRATASDNSTVSQGIAVDFTNISLDGRASENNDVYDDNRYHTTKSIFTRATLLEWLIGSSGTYNFDYDLDWGTGTPHKVTYGRELGYTTEGQYPSEELWYQNEMIAGGKQRFVHPDGAQPDEGSTQYSGFNAFLPYVKDVSEKTDIAAKTGFKYQLMVNHQPSERIEGCGTYNDPYIIKNAADLVTISKWLSADANFNSDEIDVDLDGDMWCDAKTEGENVTLKCEHVTFTCNVGECTAVDANNQSVSWTAEKMRQYLAGAYYKIELSGSTSIELSASSGFLGLGTKVEGLQFHGVIEGNHTTLVNKTQYPLINFSSGSVVRNLPVTVDAVITLDDAADCYDYITTDKGRMTYGALIGVVAGGDNIIDNVQVTFGDSVVRTKGLKAQYQAVGGYIGAVVNGGVIFRNMAEGTQGLADANVTAVKGKNLPQINGISDANLANYTQYMTHTDNHSWLYVNPFIGRVINGFAVTESSSYKPEHDDCTLDNGLKNYSITDISDELDNLSISGKKITVPNAQAFFLMSVIVNSGMGASGKLGYSNVYTKRTAAYDQIGSDAVAAADCADYQELAKKDGTAGTAYIISHYAVSSASTLGSGTEWQIELNANDRYDLPDGYRGIGNFYYNDDSLLLNVKSFDGKKSTIHMNSYFYYYHGEKISNSLPAFDTIYLPYMGISGEPKYGSETDAGFGLFNRQVQGGATYKDLTLSGTVKCDVINNRTGQHIPYKNDTGSNTDNWSNRKSVLSCGALFGNFSGVGDTTIQDVALRDISVSSAKMSGGMIGIVPLASNVNLSIKITENGPDSYGINVHSGLSAGGLIARYQQGICTIDFNGHRFEIDEVVSDTVANTDHYYYGVGGIIGTLRAGSGSPAPAVTIKNVTIGDPDAKQPIFVGCSQENCGINVGGLIGTLNRASPTMINVHVYNVTLTSKGSATHVGGAFGHCRTEAKVIVQNSSIISNIEDDENKAYIYGNGHVGGFLGNSPETADKALDFKVENTVIEGYTISGKVAGGLVGERSAKSNSNYLTVNNFLIKDCVIMGDEYAAGLVGHLITPMNGYNIMTTNLEFRPHTSGGTIKNLGYLVGRNDSEIKIVAFSRNEKREMGEESTMIQPMTGGDNAYNYGANGYVIFADYRGNDTNHAMTTCVDVATGLQRVGEALPYVNINPRTEIDASGSPKYLTGDGAQSVTISKILSDISSENLGYYATAASVAGQLEGKIGSFKDEMGTKTLNIGGRDFPVLIIDDINKANTTERINNYIAMLTNTTPGAYNYAAYGSNKSMFRTVIHKCTFDSTGTVLSIKAGDADEISGASTAGNAVPCLKRNSTQFYMNANDTDTAAENAQFTLIDVQYLDPSGEKGIVYHLYIPVYVRKVVEYDFNIHVESGTNYKVNAPAALTNNTLIENIGVPVTFEFAYTYNRTPAEWIMAVNGGDSLLANYTKTLIFSNSSKLVNGSMPDLPADTKMVLIDTQNQSKAYYLDNLSSAAFTGTGTEKRLVLSAFSNGSDQFEPMTFNDMMLVEVVQSNSGTLVLSSAHPSNTYPDIVTDTSDGVMAGETFRYSPADESGISASDRYTVRTLSFKNDGNKLVEHYFLSVYTTFSSSTPVFHYAVSAGKDLGTSPYPSRVTKASENNVANLFMGYIYDQHVYIDRLAVGGDEDQYCVNSDNSQLSANLRATIQLTGSATSNGIKTYLGNTNPPSIYESLMLQFDKYTETESVVGIAGVDDVDITSYKINGSPVANYDSVTTASYIEMRNNEPLARYLKDGTVVIEAAVTVSFDTVNGGIQDQFYPQSPDTRGTKVIALSKIASSSSQTAYSKISISTDKLWDSEHGTEGRTNRYYTDDKEEATLAYDALEIPEEGQIPQLGINANDPNDVMKLPASIRTLGTYNLEGCQRAYNDSQYVRVEIELKSIEDDYSTALKFFDYIDAASFKVCEGATADASQSTDTKLVYVFDKSAIAAFYQDKVYRIPIDLHVFSGNKFEVEELQYSNYAVFLNVYLLDADKNVISSSVPVKSDYIKFTNARIYLDKVDPDKDRQ